MNYKNLKANYLANKELKKHYKDLYETAVNELHFEKMSVDYLIGVLEEVETVSKLKLNQALITKIVENAKERHYLDKLIHTDLIFKK